jgi:hypothetical protein
MCGPLRRVATLRDSWRSRPARARRAGAIGADDGTCGVMRAACGGYWYAECFGMGPAVVLGQDLTEAAGPLRHGAVADLAAVTGSWVTVTGKRRGDDLIICFHDASPAGVILP